MPAAVLPAQVQHTPAVLGCPPLACSMPASEVTFTCLCLCRELPPGASPATSPPAGSSSPADAASNAKADELMQAMDQACDDKVSVSWGWCAGLPVPAFLRAGGPVCLCLWLCGCLLGGRCWCPRLIATTEDSLQMPACPVLDSAPCYAPLQLPSSPPCRPAVPAQSLTALLQALEAVTTAIAEARVVTSAQADNSTASGTASAQQRIPLAACFRLWSHAALRGQDICPPDCQLMASTVGEAGMEWVGNMRPPARGMIVTPAASCRCRHVPAQCRHGQ